ncbi:MAG: amidohydrolase, partial [Kofleriaceae bacterium]|nr:amidohydrolase [Kofleriaceae bacterium]
MVWKLVTSRSIWRSALLISLAIGCGGPRSTESARPQVEADLVLVNGDIFTPEGHRTTLAIAGDRIIAGEPPAKAKRTIDLGGKSVVIGLTDAHCHLYGLGTDLENVSVRGLDSEAAVAKVVDDAAAKRSPNEWLVGRGWDQNRWPGQQFPTKATLDAVVNDRPVLLERVDGHAYWVNSNALAAARITKDTKDPPGGKIVRDASGEPTGVLVDNATLLVDKAMPVASPEVRERRILAAAKMAVGLGFTGVHEMGIEDATVEVYEKLADDKRLPLRVTAYLSGSSVDPESLRTREPIAADGTRFAMPGVKFFADGALGSRGARLYEDYDDDKGNRGLWVTEPAKLTASVDAAVAGGWQTAIHAIGDAGIGAVLDAYEAAEKKHPGEHRLRIEHTQVIAAKDVPRMVATHAIASMQPTHATSDMPWAEARVGKARIAGAYAWRTMLDQKIPLAFGSDFPVEEVSPLLGLHAAVNRTDTKGQPAGGWYPDQKMTLDEAVAAFTTGAAYAAFAEGTYGQRADITIFDGKLEPATILERKAIMTIVGGE